MNKLKDKGISISEHVISEVCENAVETLVNDLDFFWPGYAKIQNNFMSERNLSLHLANAFTRRGFHVYAEVSFDSRKQTANKADLLILSPEKNGEVDLIVVESKRMWRSNEYVKLEQDMIKIESFFRYFKEKVFREKAAGESDFPYEIGRQIGIIANLSWENPVDEALVNITNTQWNRSSLLKITNSLNMDGLEYGFPLTGHDKKLTHYKSVLSHALFYEFEIEKAGLE